MFSTFLTRVKMKTIIFLVASSITVLACQTLNTNGWRCTVLEDSNTLKLDRLGEIGNVSCHFLVISKINFILVVVDLFPWSNDGLGRNTQNFCMHVFIFFFFYFWWVSIDFLMWFWSGVNMCRLVNEIMKMIVLNMNKFRIHLFLFKLQLKF